jgi:hypothetical protein
VTTEPDPVKGLYSGLVEELSSYSGGLSDLGRVIGRLEPLIEQLEEHEGGDAVKALRREWGQLEILYALALDEGRGQLTVDEERDVAEIVADLLRGSADRWGGR